MNALLQRSKSLLADMMPLTAARVGRVFSGGPLFQREGKLWRIEDASGKIFVPSIRRYGMYRNSVGRRINDMLERYQLGDLRNALVIDVGAHVGEFAMASAPFAAKVISFEPDPVAREALLKNTASLRNVEVRPIALSDRNGPAKFFVATTQADSSLFEPEHYADVIEVDARRLEDLQIPVEGYSRVVLKMDAEGFEPEVLRGAGEWLRFLHVASVDVAPERAGKDTYAEVKGILEASGMRQRAFTPHQVLIMERD
jgi:FkbM family methyltransferase